MHKLTAGSGYDYLTRQVAVQDSTEKGHASLASYYTERGESPGVWVGSGLASIDGLNAGDVVTAEQMLALFGSGHHPLAEERRAELPDDATGEQVRAVTRLGTPFKVYTGDVSEFRIEVARRLEDLNVAAGRQRSTAIPADVRARVRTEVAREFFEREYGREPADARELAGTVAKLSRPKTTAVAGFDLTFSPVKSVSALWAIADPSTAAKVELAHQRAVKDALTFIETHALFTRLGTNGVRQVDVSGLVAAAFTHRDSRAGDPDLHTHVAVANKVQTLDGRWLAVDGRVLYKAKVTASETYNTALERHLIEGLGVRFAERANPDPRKRCVREIVGVDPALNQRWSTRRVAIVARRGEVAGHFQQDHGRPPTPVEMIQLAQRATLETRDPKHEPRTLAEQRTAWHRQAVEVLGSEHVDLVVAAALSPTTPSLSTVDNAWVSATSVRVLDEVEQRRSTWQVWHVRAEALRQIRTADVPAAHVATVVDLIVDEVLNTKSVLLASDADPIIEPAVLRRQDEASVYQVAGSDMFTSERILAAEARIVAAAGEQDGRAVAAGIVDLALLESTTNGIGLNLGQASLVRELATSGARVQLAIAAAGTGKTTAMAVLASAWEESGGTVIGLAPSAAAAAALAEQTGTTTDTLAKLIHNLNNGQSIGWMDSIGPKSRINR